MALTVHPWTPSAMYVRSELNGQGLRRKHGGSHRQWQAEARPAVPIRSSPCKVRVAERTVPRSFVWSTCGRGLLHT